MDNISSATSKQARLVAQKQIDKEDFNAQVEVEKAKLKAAKWWHRFIPKIQITIGKW